MSYFYKFYANFVKKNNFQIALGAKICHYSIFGRLLLLVPPNYHPVIDVKIHKTQKIRLSSKYYTTFTLLLNTCVLKLIKNPNFIVFKTEFFQMTCWQEVKAFLSSYSSVYSIVSSKGNDMNSSEC